MKIKKGMILIIKHFLEILNDISTQNNQYMWQIYKKLKLTIFTSSTYVVTINIFATLKSRTLFWSQLTLCDSSKSLLALKIFISKIVNK